MKTRLVHSFALLFWYYHSCWHLILPFVLAQSHASCTGPAQGNVHVWTKTEKAIAVT